MIGASSQLMAAASSHLPDPLSQVPQRIVDGGDDPNHNGLRVGQPINFTVNRILTPIMKVRVILGIHHPRIRDLHIVLRSPGGTGVTLLSGIGIVGVDIQQGALTGGGTVGNLSIQAQGTLNPTGAFTASAAPFADYSALVLDSATDKLTVTPGAASLGGVNGVGGAALLLYEGVWQNAEIITAANTGTFDGFPTAGAGITFNPATVLVTGGGDNGRTVWIDPSTYVENEGAGSVTVTAVWSAGPGTAVIRNYGGTVQRGIDINTITVASALRSDPRTVLEL